MRSLAIAAFVLLSALLAPMASAEPQPPECGGEEVAPNVSLNEECGVDARVRLMSCPIAGSWKDYTVGTSTVSIYTCDSP